MISIAPSSSPGTPVPLPPLPPSLKGFHETRGRTVPAALFFFGVLGWKL